MFIVYGKKKGEELGKKIDDYLNELMPDMKRVSSGSADFTNTLTENLRNTELFSDVIYLEGRHSFWMDKDHYIGAWKSVNDVQVQLGPDKFKQFLDFIEKGESIKEGQQTPKSDSLSQQKKTGETHTCTSCTKNSKKYIFIFGVIAILILAYFAKKFL